MRVGKCSECGRRRQLPAQDPRTPPLDVGFCLCRSCGKDAYEQAINDAKENLSELKFSAWDEVQLQ